MDEKYERVYKKIYDMSLKNNRVMHDVFELITGEEDDYDVTVKCLKRMESAGIVKMRWARKFTILVMANSIEKFIRIENGSDEKLITRIHMGNRVRIIEYPKNDKRTTEDR